MKTYGGGFMLEILDAHDLIDYCGALFAYTDVPIAKRVSDVQKICRLSMQNTRIYLTQTDCFVTLIKRAYAMAQSMEELEQTLALLSCIKDLDMLEEVARKAATFAYYSLSNKVSKQFLHFTYFFSKSSTLRFLSAPTS
jgi:hypothetical protein